MLTTHGSLYYWQFESFRGEGGGVSVGGVVWCRVVSCDAIACAVVVFVAVAIAVAVVGCCCWSCRFSLARVSVGTTAAVHHLCPPRRFFPRAGCIAHIGLYL